MGKKISEYKQFPRKSDIFQEKDLFQQKLRQMRYSNFEMSSNIHLNTFLIQSDCKCSQVLYINSTNFFVENLMKNGCVRFTFSLDCKATLTKCVYRFNQSIMSLTPFTISQLLFLSSFKLHLNHQLISFSVFIWHKQI